jgi:hypothetical protein
MVTYSPLFKVAIIYLGVSLILVAGGINYHDVLSEQQKFVHNNTSNSFVNSMGETGGQYTLGSGITGTQPNLGAGASPVGGGLGLIEVLRVVWNGVDFLLKVALAIPTLLASFPGFIQYFVAIPLAVVAIIALLFFVRSG